MGEHGDPVYVGLPFKMPRGRRWQKPKLRYCSLLDRLDREHSPLTGSRSLPDRLDGLSNRSDEGQMQLTGACSRSDQSDILSN